MFLEHQAPDLAHACVSFASLPILFESCKFSPPANDNTPPVANKICEFTGDDKLRFQSKSPNSITLFVNVKNAVNDYTKALTKHIKQSR